MYDVLTKGCFETNTDQGQYFIHVQMPFVIHLLSDKMDWQTNLCVSKVKHQGL